MAARRWTLRSNDSDKPGAHQDLAPMRRSTGPRSARGKQVASRNAFKGGHRAVLRKLSRALKRQRPEAIKAADPRSLNPWDLQLA
ncbi:MAG: hypothetical protein U1E77_14320 [Inhella sp.]